MFKNSNVRIIQGLIAIVQIPNCERLYTYYFICVLWRYNEYIILSQVFYTKCIKNLFHGRTIIIQRVNWKDMMKVLIIDFHKWTREIKNKKTKYSWRDYDYENQS